VLMSSSTLWTSSGDGSFADSSSLNTIYTPTANDRALGFVTLTLTATPIAPCDSNATVSDTVTLTFSEPTTVSILRGDTNLDGIEEYATEFCGSSDYTFTADQIVEEQVASYEWTKAGDGLF